MYQFLEKYIDEEKIKPLKAVCHRIDNLVPPKFKKYFDKMGIPPSIIIFLFSLYLFVYMLFGMAGQFFWYVFFTVGSLIFSNIVGFLYPAYMSFKAIETQSKLDDRQWLTYWVVYAFFSCCELILEPVISLFASYYLIKLVFLFYLMLPQFHGATILYDLLISKLLKTHEAHIDEVIDKAVDTAGNFVGRKSTSSPDSTK